MRVSLRGILSFPLDSREARWWWWLLDFLVFREERFKLIMKTGCKVPASEDNVLVGGAFLGISFGGFRFNENDFEGDLRFLSEGRGELCVSRFFHFPGN